MNNLPAHIGPMTFYFDPFPGYAEYRYTVTGAGEVKHRVIYVYNQFEGDEIMRYWNSQSVEHGNVWSYKGATQ